MHVDVSQDQIILSKAYLTQINIYLIQKGFILIFTGVL